MNWRASATGPASDRSSNSGGEKEAPPPTSARRSTDRADKDPHWRITDAGGRPPSGSKNKKKNNCHDTHGNLIRIYNTLTCILTIPVG